MPARVINLFDIPNDIMLVVSYQSNVSYRNQVGGVQCRQVEIEGVLAPIGLSPEATEQIMKLPFVNPGGLAAEVADRIDEILASDVCSRYLKVDRSRLRASCEAWVFVQAETPEGVELQFDGAYFGAPYGFGAARGVLTWPNSD